MSSSVTEERQGVYFGVSELIQYSSHDHVSSTRSISLVFS